MKSINKSCRHPSVFAKPSWLKLRRSRATPDCGEPACPELCRRVEGPTFKQRSILSFLLLCIGLSTPLRSVAETFTYYLYIADFAASFIEIPTSNVQPDSPTLNSSYLAGRAAVYNNANNLKVGTCSASFLNMQNADGIFTDISNYISTDDGMIVIWFTPTTLINLELDSIIHGMVTECIVTVTTKVGFAPLYGQTFNLIVSSDSGKIYFQFTRIGTLF